jgi:hypothetical protein
MAYQVSDARNPEAGKPEQAKIKKAYHRPKLTKLGSLRDMTMTKSNTGQNDGQNKKGTKRGGNFHLTDCGA